MPTQLDTSATDPNATSSLEGTMPDAGTSAPGNLQNLQAALRAALSEASQNQAQQRMSQMSGVLEPGVNPSVFTAAIGLAKQGLQTSNDQIFGDTVSAYEKETSDAIAAKNSALSTLHTMVQEGTLAETPDGTLLAMEKAAGLGEGTVLAWKAKVKQSQDQDEAHTAMTNKDLSLQIQQRQQALQQGTPTKITRTDITKMGLPASLIGTSWQDLNDQMQADDAPDWFQGLVEQKSQQSFSADKLASLWTAFRNNFNSKYNNTNGTSAPTAGTSSSGLPDFNSF